MQSVLASHKENVILPAYGERKPLSLIGLWSSILSALFAIGFGVSVVIMIFKIQSSPQASAGWTGINDYMANFQSFSLLPVIPSILLAPVFVALMVCVHAYAPASKRIWSQLGLAYTLLYAGMAFTNYAVQLISVRRALLSGEAEGLEMLVHGNPHSIFWSLVSCYIFMNLAMLFAAPVFEGGSLETWIRRFFYLNGISAVFTVASVLIDNPMIFNFGSLVIWCPIFSIA
ncbi:MAG: hypothetical protein EHM41_23475, partial [Chloroflexi bacterium]